MRNLKKYVFREQFHNLYCLIHLIGLDKKVAVVIKKKNNNNNGMKPDFNINVKCFSLRKVIHRPVNPCFNNK